LQPQLIVCGRLGMQPLADARRREFLFPLDLQSRAPRLAAPARPR